MSFINSKTSLLGATRKYRIALMARCLIGRISKEIHWVDFKITQEIIPSWDFWWKKYRISCVLSSICLDLLILWIYWVKWSCNIMPWCLLVVFVKNDSSKSLRFNCKKWRITNCSDSRIFGINLTLLKKPSKTHPKKNSSIVLPSFIISSQVNLCIALKSFYFFLSDVRVDFSSSSWCDSLDFADYCMSFLSKFSQINSSTS